MMDEHPTNDDAEARIARLEAEVDELQTDVRDIRNGQLTKWDVAQVMPLVIAGISGAAFVLPRLAVLVGGREPAAKRTAAGFCAMGQRAFISLI